jgi:hypothetical protein
VAEALADTPPSEPVADGDRAAAIARLHELVRNGELGLDQFATSLELVLAADSQPALEGATRRLPPVVRVTPSSRRLTGPSRVDAGIARLDLGDGWQLGVDTTVTTNTARVTLDLTRATWDSTEVHLHLRSNTGKIDVIVPNGVAVQLRTIGGRVIVDALGPPLPGGPMLRVDASTKAGRIRIGGPGPPLAP